MFYIKSINILKPQVFKLLFFIFYFELQISLILKHCKLNFSLQQIYLISWR